MKKYAKIIAIVFVLVLCAMSFMACSFEYGTPDKLDMANSSVGERILIGLQVALLGVGVVFAVLFLLIGFIILLKYGFKYSDVLKAKLSAKKSAKKANIKDENKDKPVGNIPQIEGLGNEDEEIAVAITAAIMAYYDANVAPTYVSNVKFRVRNIKEIK